MSPDPDSKPAPWAAFAYRDYRLLWAAMVVTSMVGWMRILGTSQWLFDETGSAVLVGFIGAIQLVVQIPALLWGGTLADRIDRKKLMLLGSVVTAVTLLALGVLDRQGMLTPWMVYLAIALTAATQMLASPARSALIPIVIPERHLLVATSTDTASANAAAIAGPLLFAVVAASLGLGTVFLVAGTMAVFASCIPPLIRAAGVATRSAHEDGTTTYQRTVEGFRYVAKHPILPGLFLLDDSAWQVRSFVRFQSIL